MALKAGPLNILDGFRRVSPPGRRVFVSCRSPVVEGAAPHAQTLQQAPDHAGPTRGGRIRCLDNRSCTTARRGPLGPLAHRRGRHDRVASRRSASQRGTRCWGVEEPAPRIGPHRRRRRRTRRRSEWWLLRLAQQDRSDLDGAVSGREIAPHLERAVEHLNSSPIASGVLGTNRRGAKPGVNIRGFESAASDPPRSDSCAPLQSRGFAAA